MVRTPEGHMSDDLGVLYNALAARFPKGDEKVLPKGKGLVYITARTAMNRLDDVLGWANWWDKGTPLGDNSYQCELFVRLPGGRVISKFGVGGAAGMADAGDDDKSKESDAFKRAAVKFGVGRYLYGDGVPYLEPAEDTPSSLPAPARASLPAPAADAPREPEEMTPRTGPELVGWAVLVSKARGHDMLGFFEKLGQIRNWPGLPGEWPADIVATAHASARLSACYELVI